MENKFVQHFTSCKSGFFLVLDNSIIMTTGRRGFET